MAAVLLHCTQITQWAATVGAFPTVGFCLALTGAIHESLPHTPLGTHGKSRYGNDADGSRLVYT